MKVSLEFSKIGRHVSDLLCTCLSAPSTAPTSVSVSEVASSSITVQWGAVDCIHHNGDITGYTVRYGVQGNGSTQTVNVSGGEATQTIISELTPSTNYSFEVAAVNSVGTGVYSNLIFHLTRGTSSHKLLASITESTYLLFCTCSSSPCPVSSVNNSHHHLPFLD